MFPFVTYQSLVTLAITVRCYTKNCNQYNESAFAILMFDVHTPPYISSSKSVLKVQTLHDNGFPKALIINFKKLSYILDMTHAST